MIVNGPTTDPAASVAMNGSSPASSSESALVKRQAGHSPAGEAPGVRGAPHRGQGVELTAMEAAYHRGPFGAAGFGSKHETDFARKRALDDIAKHVLLNGRVQKIRAPEGDRYAVSRPYADARIQDLI